MSLLLLLQSAGGAPATNANAELASASGSAAAASVSLAVAAGLAEGAGSAAAAAASLGVPAGLTEGAGSAAASTTTLVSHPTAGLTEATGAALDASVTTSSAVNVQAELTTAAGSALEASILRPTWVSPANGSNMATSPVLVFTIPDVGSAAHFWMELDTAATFDTGNLQTIRSDQAQTGWQFWDDAQWQDVPVGGVAVDYAGNEARYTVQQPLAAGTWYRRVRAGV